MRSNPNIFFDRTGKITIKPKGIKPKKRVSVYGLFITDPKKMISDMSSSFRGNPDRMIGENVIENQNILTVTNTWSTKWDLPGGMVEDGETNEEALKREFTEETGHEIKSLLNKPFFNIKSNFYADDIDVYYYSTLSFYEIKEVKLKKKKPLFEEEIKEVKWVELSKVNKNSSKIFNIEAIGKLLKSSNG